MRRRSAERLVVKSLNQLRALTYARVSTSRQAQHELSLSEQNRQVASHAAMHRMIVVKTYVDGQSGRTDARPQFQQMFKYATDPANNIQVVIVYNFSRFFRNLADYVHYRRLFNEAGVKLVSATQEIPDGPAGILMENLIAAFDDHSSAVNSEAVKDMMAANAENGFWNGAHVPFGYSSFTDCILNKKEKKKLIINEDESLVVRMIHRWYLNGDGSSGPMGIKAITTRLNEMGYTLRSGKPFYTSAVELILTSETYVGTAYYNRRDSKTGIVRPRAEWIAIPTPPIIERDAYDAVQRIMLSRAPKVTAPRVVNGPTLLTGLAQCDCCAKMGEHRAGMMLRTGKSGQYRYLVCSNKTTKSIMRCDAPALRMEIIDDLVISQLEARVFNPDRLKALLRSMIDHSQEGHRILDQEIERQILAIRKAEQAVRNLGQFIANDETGDAANDPTLLNQYKGLKLQLSELTRTVEILKQRRQLGTEEITAGKLHAFSKAICQRLRDANPSFRRQWVHLFVDEVLIGRDNIIVKGSKNVLFEAARQGNDITAPMVPIFARKWRARKDSNL